MWSYACISLFFQDFTSAKDCACRVHVARTWQGVVALPLSWCGFGIGQSVCSVPLTSVLLLFELTQDYSIILPLMFAVSVASAVATFYSDEPVEVDLQEPVEVPTVVVERITSTLDEDPMDVRVETVYSYETLKRLRVYSAMSTSYLVLDDGARGGWGRGEQGERGCDRRAR